MQFDFGTIDPLSKTGTELADDLNKWRDAIHTTHTGLTRPAYVKAGMLWMDSSTTPVITLYVFDGAVDIKVGDFNNVTHEGNFGTAGVDLTTDQTIGGIKTFVETIAASGLNATGAVAGASLATESTLSANGNVGIDGQVLTSKGVGQPAVWGSITSAARIWKPLTLVLGTEYTAPAWDIEINVSYVATANTGGGTGYICTITGGEVITFTRAGGAAIATGVAAGSITIPANSKYKITAFGAPTSATFKELS